MGVCRRCSAYRRGEVRAKEQADGAQVFGGLRSTVPEGCERGDGGQVAGAAGSARGRWQEEASTAGGKWRTIEGEHQLHEKWLHGQWRREQ